MDASTCYTQQHPQTPAFSTSPNASPNPLWRSDPACALGARERSQSDSTCWRCPTRQSHDCAAAALSWAPQRRPEHKTLTPATRHGLICSVPFIAPAGKGPYHTLICFILKPKLRALNRGTIRAFHVSVDKSGIRKRQQQRISNDVKKETDLRE